MITKVKQKLADLGKSSCISTNLHGQEKGKSVNLNPRGEALKIKVDGCLIQDTKRCDCLYFYQPSPSKRFAILVELKGIHYPHAIQQFEETIIHKNYQQLFTVASPSKRVAVAIVSKNAKTNRPDKDEWEEKYKYRLHILPRDDNQVVELHRDVIKQ